jgi:hypothetical protein
LRFLLHRRNAERFRGLLRDDIDETSRRLINDEVY